MASSCKKRKTIYKYLENVVCNYCNTKLLFKNLRSHTNVKHGQGRVLKYKSAENKCVTEMFPPESSKVQNENTIKIREREDAEAKNLQEKNINEMREKEDAEAKNKPKTAAFHDDGSFIESAVKQITDQLIDMSSTIKRLAMENKELKCKINKKSSSSEFKFKLTLDQKQILIKICKKHGFYH